MKDNVNLYVVQSEGSLLGNNRHNEMYTTYFFFTLKSCSRHARWPVEIISTPLSPPAVDSISTPFSGWFCLLSSAKKKRGKERKKKHNANRSPTLCLAIGVIIHVDVTTVLCYFTALFANMSTRVVARVNERMSGHIHLNKAIEFPHLMRILCVYISLSLSLLFSLCE